MSEVVMVCSASMRFGMFLTLSVAVATVACSDGGGSEDQHGHDGSGHDPTATKSDAGHGADDGTPHGSNGARPAADAASDVAHSAGGDGHPPGLPPGTQHDGTDGHPGDAGALPGATDAGTPKGEVTGCDKRTCEEAIKVLLAPAPEERDRVVACCISVDECGLSFKLDGEFKECFTPVGVAPNGGAG